MVAETLFRKANLPDVWNWTNPAWGPSNRSILLNVKFLTPDGDTQLVPQQDRDPQRDPTPSTKAAVLRRDGYRCRYCGIPVISADIRKVAQLLYPTAVPWNGSIVHEQHAAFQCFWLQYDHVVPHSHGGSSSSENIVVTCGLCNYGKDKYTLKQLDICDPHLRPAEFTSWDGLERLRPYAPAQPKPLKHVDLNNRNTPTRKQVAQTASAHSAAFFFPGAWISKGYVYTPMIYGKERWFKIGPGLTATPATRHGIAGCCLICDPSDLLKRGLPPDEFADLSSSS